MASGKPGTVHPLVIAHLAVLLFGFSGLFGKFLAIPPVFIVFGRTVTAGVFLILFIRVFNIKTVKPAGLIDVLWLACQGLLLALHWILFFKSIQLSTVAVGLLTFSTFPIFTVVMESFLFREKITLEEITATVMIMVGTYFVIGHFNAASGMTAGGILGVLSGFTFAVLALLNRYNVRRIDPISTCLYQNCSAAFVLLIPFFFIETPSIGFREALLILFLGVFCTALAHTLFVKALAFLKAGTVSIITGLEPVWGIIFSMILLDEIPEVQTITGGIIILAASMIAQKASGSAGRDK